MFLLAPEVRLTAGGQVLALTAKSTLPGFPFPGVANAGNIRIGGALDPNDPSQTLPARLVEATGRVILGDDVDDQASSGVFSDSQPDSGGDAGSVSVNADEVRVTEGGTLSARSEGTGRAGTLLVEAGLLRVVGSDELDTALTVVSSDLPPNAPVGTWLFRVTFDGQTHVRPFGVGMDPVPLEAASWGGIKARCD